MYTFSSLYHIKARWSLLFILVMCTASFQAQTNVVLQMQQMLGDRPFAYNLTSQAEMGYPYYVTRLQYYVSEITLIHDGGQRTIVPEYFLLIDPAKDSVFVLGDFPVTDLEQIEFWIGVDSAHNHLDPATYPANHPLALHNPSMHWGWSGGYRFMAFEGYAGHTPAYMPNNFQIHTIADENYQKVSLSVDELTNSDTIRIPIRADYNMLLRRIDVSPGLEFHSSYGPAKQISLNTRYVFSSVLTSNRYQPKPERELFISPNPATDFFTLTIPWSGNGPLTFRLTDMLGNTIFEKIVFAPAQIINLTPSIVPGIYLATLSDRQQLFTTKKVVIE
jgi:hypothetical protein